MFEKLQQKRCKLTKAQCLLKKACKEAYRKVFHGSRQNSLDKALLQRDGDGEQYMTRFKTSECLYFPFNVLQAKSSL